MKATLIALMLGCVLTLFVSSPALTHAAEIEIRFDNDCTIDNCVPTSPANGVAFRPSVNPPDPRLGGPAQQLTFEPQGSDVRNRHVFDLVRIEVASGFLNVGIQYAAGDIAVYNNVGPGTWPLPDGRNIDRVTLEEIGGGFVVRSLVIEPVPDAPVRFIALGDTGTGDNNQRGVAQALKKWCTRHGCSFALLLGDNFYETGVMSCKDSQFNTKFETPYKPLGIPFFAALGNHDYGNGDPYWWARAGDQYQYAGADGKYKECMPDPKDWIWSGNWRMGAAGTDPYRYYTFQQGNVRFLALDTTPMVATAWQDDPQKGNGTGKQSTYVKTQQEFLDAAMGSTHAWKIAFGHHPYVSNGRHGNAGSYDDHSGTKCRGVTPDSDAGWQCGLQVKTSIEKLCAKGLDLYLSGHDHNLQWLVANCGSRPMDFIVSGAGAKLTGCDGDSDPEFCKQNQDKTLFQLRERGFVYIVIAGQRMDVSIVQAKLGNRPEDAEVEVPFARLRSK